MPGYGDRENPLINCGCPCGWHHVINLTISKSLCLGMFINAKVEHVGSGSGPFGEQFGEF